MQNIIEKNGFAAVSSVQIAEMQGTLHQMVHTVSGAKLVWLERPDENMTFAIGFRTIPTDSTGVFHILEHSVLGGSEKYPVREPFVELLKSSLQTFLNAMTFPDKTVYPFSSRNRKDFMNLMGIYMDAVLHPTAISNPNTFLQEGWRMELPEDGDPIFQGVVYNEMKGAFSNIHSVLEHTMMRSLFPDTCYRHESGGNPENIPELTYEQFVSEHAKYYHPSNALIVLDGQVDLDACLAFLNECLKDYPRQDMVFPIPMQKSLPYAEGRFPYEIGAEEDPKGKAFVSYGKLLCGFDDPVTMHAANLLADYLADGSEAPLTRAVLDAGLGDDISVGLHDGMQQEWFGWQVINTDEEKLPEIKAVIRSTVQKILDEGLDQERLLGCYNSLAFKLLDRDSYGYPRGLVEALNILEPWLYNGNPAQNLAYRAILEDLKSKLTSGWFEDFLRRCMLDDSEGFLAVMIPSQTLGQQRIAQEQARAAAYWAGLSEAQKEENRRALDRLHTWQQTPDAPEALASIPMLSLADVTGKPKPIIWKEDRCGDTPVLLHPVNSDLVYMDLFFDASDLTPEEMPVVSLMSTLLGILGTSHYSGAQVQSLIRQKIGDCSIQVLVMPKDCTSHRTALCMRSVSLPAYAEETAALLTEILTQTSFTDADTLRKTLRQEKAAGIHKLTTAGNRYALSRTMARQTSTGAAKEAMSGFAYLRWIQNNADADQAALEALMQQLEALSKRIFVRDRLTVSVSENAAGRTAALAEAFPAGQPCAKEASFPLLPDCREGLLIPAGVGYAAKSINLGHIPEAFHGSYYVLSNLLTYEHLWNVVRVQGGAYGTGFRADPAGDVYATSYRDPSPGKTLNHFDACADVLTQFCKERTDLTKYILGAMSDADPLLGAGAKLHLAEARYFRGITQEVIDRRYEELVHCSADDLLKLLPALNAMACSRNFCITGGKEQLDACASLDTILDLQN